MNKIIVILFAVIMFTACENRPKQTQVIEEQVVEQVCDSIEICNLVDSLNVE